MMSRCQHIGHGEKCLEKGFVPFDRRRNDNQRRVSETGTNGFRLTSFVSKAPQSSLHTCAIKTLLTELAGAISKVIWGDDAVPALECSDLWPNILNHAHPFMPYLPTWRIGTLSPIRPQVGSTDTGMGNPDHGVSWLKNGRIRDLLNLYIKGSTKNCCSHCLLLLSISQSNKTQLTVNLTGIPFPSSDDLLQPKKWATPSICSRKAHVLQAKSTRQELPTGLLIEQEKRAGEVTPSPVPLQEPDRVVPSRSAYRSRRGDWRSSLPCSGR